MRCSNARDEARSFKLQDFKSNLMSTLQKNAESNHSNLISKANESMARTLDDDEWFANFHKKKNIQNQKYSQRFKTKALLGLE